MELELSEVASKSEESQFGLFIDFYIKQSEGQEFVTKGLG